MPCYTACHLAVCRLPANSSAGSLVQLAGLAVGVVQPQLGVQVVQLAVAAEQEGAHLKGMERSGGKSGSFRVQVAVATSGLLSPAFTL